LLLLVKAMEDDGENLTWEEKYYQAEQQIQKFRSQAGRVRELLNEKLTEYEDKVSQVEAEKETFVEKARRFECVLEDREETIKCLHEKIGILRDERAKENLVWEEREKIMKNWIKTKITSLLQEIEDIKEEKKTLENRVSIGVVTSNDAIFSFEKRPHNPENDNISSDESEENSYEEVFDQILGSLKKPKINSLWEHSTPNSPNLSPPPDLPLNQKIENPTKIRPKAPTPDNPVLSRVFPGIRRCDSDDYGLRSADSSPKANSKLRSSLRFNERRFSDVTSPFSPGYESVQVRKGFISHGKPNLPPPPVPKHNRIGVTRPLLVTNGYDKQISIEDDVFDSSAKPLKNRVGDQNRVLKSRSEDKDEEADDYEPYYHILKETLCGIDYESENAPPVYATLRGVASQIRVTPFTGESTDSEADGVDSDPSPTASPSGFKSYISNGDAKSTTLSSETLYDLPYDCLPNAKKKEFLFTHKKTAGNTSTLKRSPKILRKCAPYTEENMRKEILEKSGYLIKLGGRVKNWKKRWFVLMDAKLAYYKTKEDTSRKPLGQIPLESVSSVSRSERLNTFELKTPTRTYYMTAESPEIVDGWLQALRNNLKRFSGARILAKAGEKTIHEGWVTKVKGGTSRHCWCVLKEKTLLFYKNETEISPWSALSLREIVNIEQVKERSDSYLGENDGRCTLMLQTLDDGHPTYLVVGSQFELEEWRKLIMTAENGIGNKETETEFENVVTKLMSVDGDSGSRFWLDPVLVHSRNLMRFSLSALPSPELTREALRMFQSIRLYSTTPLNEKAIDYHISLAQDTIQSCFNHTELQTEIYCQLIKQTNKGKSQNSNRKQIQQLLTGQSDWKASLKRGDVSDSSPVPEFTYIQCWHLLALCCSLFLPKLKILWLLKAHLKKWSNPSTDVGKYALYCSRSIERTISEGDREVRPSRPEVMSIVLRNPYYIPFPMSIPVYFLNGTYQVFSFDGSTTVAEFCERINMEIGIRECSESGYALFSDNPIASVEHCLQGELKFCDVISKWEQAMKCYRQGKIERQKAIKLTYKNRLYFKSLAKTETKKERFLLCYQVNESILAGHLQPAPKTAYRLAALLAQIEFGGYRDNFKNLNDVIKRFVADCHRGTTRAGDNGGSKRKMYKSIADSWSDLRGKSIDECVSSYLGIVRSFPLFGSRIFEAKERIFKGKKEVQTFCILAIEEEKLSILDYSTRAPRTTYDYTSVVTFGGYKDDFMLVIQDDIVDTNGRTFRHLFAMSKGKVLEVTFLIASYINAVVCRKGLNLELQKDKPRSESNLLGNRGSVQLWDMESFV